MSKNKLGILVGVAIAGLLLVFLIVKSLFGQSGSQATQNSQQIPDYVLSSSEESSIKEFVQNFITLYNSYSTEDTSNLTALGDYQTQKMQEYTAELVQRIGQNSTQLEVRTEVDTSSFSYSYTEADKLIVYMSGQETKSNLVTGSRIFESVKYKVSLVKQGDRWVVDSISQ